MSGIADDVKTGNFQHVYLLCGEEAYLRKYWRDRLLAALMPDQSSMNYTVYQGDKAEEGQVIDQAETMPFFADRRVIRLDDTGLFKRSAELLPDYMKHLPDYLVMVFTESEVDKRSRMYKAVKSAGCIAEFGPQSEAALQSWVLRRLKAAGINIRKSNMDYFLSRTGTDMTHIGLEVDKLVNYCAANGKSEAARQDIDAIVTVEAEGRIFDMVAAVTRGDRTQAFDLYADLLSLREPPMRILYLIARQFNQLLIIREMDGKGAAIPEIASKASMPPFAVRRNLPIAKRYKMQELEDAVNICIGMETEVKTGKIGDRLAVELALTQLTKKQ